MLPKISIKKLWKLENTFIETSEEDLWTLKDNQLSKNKNTLFKKFRLNENSFYQMFKYNIANKMDHVIYNISIKQ